MTRKDYVRIARALRAAQADKSACRSNDSGDRLSAEIMNAGVRRAARMIADELKSDNGRFDRERFFAAAGLNETGTKSVPPFGDAQ